MSDISKVDGMSLDLEKQNIDKIKELFPEAVEEGKINFDMLRAMLGDEVDDSREKYQFTWNGKAKAIKMAQTPSSATLRPCKDKSKNWGTTENLYIEGDNLEVLKQLQKTYYGKIKMIYIDPPYNTGNDFVYNDSFSNSLDNYKEQTNQAASSNPESNGRFHTDWLNMMYPRLLLAKNLLSDDGAIFISIDDIESDNLRKMCDEIFGEKNFKANISWQRTYSIRNDSKGIPLEVEHIFVYSKKNTWQPNTLPRTEKMNMAYSNPDGDNKLWMSGSPVASDANTHQGMVYAIQSPFTGELVYPSDKAHWRYSQNKMLDYMNEWCNYKLEDLHDEERRAKICGVTKNEVMKNVQAIVLNDSPDIALEKANRIQKKGPWPRFYFTNGGLGGIRRKVYLDDTNGRISTNYWPFEEVGHTDEAKKEIKNLFDGSAPFSTPKPTRLLKRILEISTNENDIVLDFFSGSATTADAVMKRNVSGNKFLKFIMVQLPELISKETKITICDIGEERIRRAGEQIKSDRNKEDILYEIMLKYGVFDRKVEEIIVNDKTMYRVGERYMIVCLEDSISVEEITSIGKLSPKTVIVKESSFKDDNEKINALTNLKKMGVEDIKCI